jgi:hypothetical protein
MRHTMITKGLLGWVLVLAVICIASGPSFAIPTTQNIFLVAGPVTPSPVMPDGTSVAMWGFGIEPDCSVPGDVPACFSTIEATSTSPGPRITIPPGDWLHVYLYNNGLPESVSLVIPGYGMPTPLGPTWDDSTTGGRANLTQRVRSFGLEALPGTVQVYEWDGSNAPKDGSFIYQSGTHPQVQIQMGLYGPVTRDFSVGFPNEAYNDQTPYLHERILFYSEIDPGLHAAVAGGTYGTTGPTSTVDYDPDFYRFTDAAGTTTVYTTASQPSVPACTSSDSVLYRFFNAGLQTHIPAPGHYLDLVAEDGNLYPHSRRQYSVMLPAGKTQDALTLCDGNAHNVLDRSTYASRTTPAPPGNRAPVAVNDSELTFSLTPVMTDVMANDYDLDLDSISISGSTNGSDGTVVCGPGGCTYTPTSAPPFVDTYTYTITDGAATAMAKVTVSVQFANTPPVASNLNYVTDFETARDVVLTAVDADGDDLLLAIGASPLGGMLTPLADVTRPGDHVLYTPDPGFSGVDTFTYTAHDGTNISNLATVSITVAGPPNLLPPVAVDDTASTPFVLAVVVDVLANDWDPEGAPLSITGNTGASCTGSAAGTVSCTASDCTFTPTALSAGSCEFDYDISDGFFGDTGTVTVTVTPVVPADVFTDNFNRPFGNDVDNGWVEIEDDPADVKIGSAQ